MVGTSTRRCDRTDCDRRPVRSSQCECDRASWVVSAGKRRRIADDRAADNPAGCLAGDRADHRLSHAARGAAIVRAEQATLGGEEDIAVCRTEGLDRLTTNKIDLVVAV